MKCSSPVIDTVIAKILNRWLHEQCFPKSLKIAKVMPIHKKGDRFQPQNYRSITSLTSFSKVFEKLLQKRLIKFSDKNNISTINQIKRIACRCNFANFEFIRTTIAKTSGQVCFIDLQKALDTVDQEIIVNKLERYGFWGTVLNLFRD